MKKTAKITISGTRTDKNRTQEKTELTTEGNYYIRDGVHYLTYKESEMTGMEGTTTTLKTDGECVTLIRFGKNNAQFVFEKGRQHIGYYETGYGSFSTCVLPKDIHVRMGEQNGEISVGYLLNFAGESSDNFFALQYEIQD